MFDREPALWVGLVEALIALAVGFGLDLSPEMIGGVMAVVAAITAFATRSQVTPKTQVAAKKQG